MGKLKYILKFFLRVFFYFPGLIGRHIERIAWWRSSRQTLTTPFFNPENFNIELAFEWRGEKYYTFSDPFKMPYDRGLAVLAFFEEFNMRITRELLCVQLDLVMKNINEQKVGEAYKIVEHIKNRSEWQIEPQSFYNLVSVIYFTEKENPYFYDHIANKKKIAIWQKDKDLLAFFLQKGLQELMPFASFSPEDLRNYLTGAATTTMKLLKSQYENYTPSAISNEKRQELLQQLQEIEITLNHLIAQSTILNT